MKEVVRVLKITAPSLFTMNVLVGIIDLCLGLWGWSLFNFGSAALLYFVFDKFKNENK